MEHKIIKNSQQKLKRNPNQDDLLLDLYSKPEFMKIITQQIAEDSTIDPVKINNIKQAIQNKTFCVDKLKLAEIIIKFESELFK